MLQTFAPAKINLYLHITGRRVDGYHQLDSLVSFASVGDELRLEEAESFSLSLSGPYAAALQDEPVEGNLAVKAARKLAEMLGKPLNFKLSLSKNLPIASGIGGGSSDAAAALRLLAQAWGMAKADPLLYQVAASLGQDIPCCIAAQNCYFQGIGDVTVPAPPYPSLYIVLVNPNLALSTPAVFKERVRLGLPFTPAAPLHPAPQNTDEFAVMLADRRNDLTEVASHLMPEISQILTIIAATPDCLLARMSGSGATCFGLYASEQQAQTAAAKIQKTQPNWWVVAARLGTDSPEVI